MDHVALSQPPQAPAGLAVHNLPDDAHLPTPDWHSDRDAGVDVGGPEAMFDDNFSDIRSHTGSLESDCDSLCDSYNDCTQPPLEELAMRNFDAELDSSEVLEAEESLSLSEEDNFGPLIPNQYDASQTQQNFNVDHDWYPF